MEKKGFAPIIIIFLGTVLVALGYYIYNQNVLEKILNYTTVPNEIQITPTSTETIPPTVKPTTPSSMLTPTPQPTSQPTTPPATPTESEPVYWPAPSEDDSPGKSKQLPFVGG